MTIRKATHMTVLLPGQNMSSMTTPGVMIVWTPEVILKLQLPEHRQALLSYLANLNRSTVVQFYEWFK